MAVQTVLGEIGPAEVGVALMHEHVVLQSPGVAESYPWTFDRERVIEQAVADLRSIRELGVSTIVDMTTLDLGRDVDLLATVSARAGMHIVSTTGLYHPAPAFFRHRSADQIAEFFINDLTDGVGPRGVRSGIVKCAMDGDGDSTVLERVTRAAGIAAGETGVVVSTHSSAAERTGLRQLDILEQEISPGRIVIGHCGDSSDLEYLGRLLDRGCVLGMDRFGLEQYLPTERRVEVVAELCRRGFAAQLVLSHDTFSFNDATARSYRDTHLPTWRFGYLLEAVVPMLRERGVTDSDVDQMLRHNPARLLTRHDAGHPAPTEARVEHVSG